MLTRIKPLHPNFTAPKYATQGSAAFDLVALNDGLCVAGQVTRIPLGFAIEIPEGFAMLITTRSGQGLNYGAGVPHGYGLIDSDYRGEVSMVLSCLDPFRWMAGDRIGQAIIIPVLQTEFIIARELSETLRGSGGFGSTGVAQ
jgi:dUTP pyrophosphatase